MHPDKKLELHNLSKELYGRRSYPEAQSMIKLVELLLDDEKANLLTCNRDQFERIQGAAGAYQTILDRLTKPRPGTTKE